MIVISCYDVNRAYIPFT